MSVPHFKLFRLLLYKPVFPEAPENVDVGGELIWGERTTFDGQIGRLSRIDLMARYSFGHPWAFHVTTSHCGRGLRDVTQ